MLWEQEVPGSNPGIPTTFVQVIANVDLVKIIREATLGASCAASAMKRAMERLAAGEITACFDRVFGCPGQPA